MTELHDIALVDVPVGRFVQMQQQHDAMLREFTLIALGSDPSHPAVTPRLLSLAHEMQARFGTTDPPFRGAIAAAEARGDIVTTVEMKIPFSTLRWCEDFLLLFEEGDDFSRHGQLLTPASPPEVAEFRRWIVGELIRQIRDGATPTPFWAGSL